MDVKTTSCAYWAAFNFWKPTQRPPVEKQLEREFGDFYKYNFQATQTQLGGESRKSLKI